MAKTLTLNVGGFEFKASIGRRPSPDADLRVRKLELAYARELESRFPFLREFGFILTEGNIREVIAFYSGYLPMVREETRSAGLRSLLHILRNSSDDAHLKHTCTKAIAVSDLSDGLAERAVVLSDRQDWQREATAVESAYGADIIRGPWKKAGRGTSLVLYFDNNKQILAGKDVLHIAPESDLEAYLRSGKCFLKSYVATDGQHGDCEHHDITDMHLPSASFDVVICHRVMEHVLNDRAGFSELYRILRPGGMLNFSVPQILHRLKTKEWAVPDLSHDGHIRQYGADLAETIAAAGFIVQLEPWLLGRSREELSAANAYPMRMFNCFK